MHRGGYLEEPPKSKIAEDVKSDDPFADFSSCFQKVDQSKNKSDAFNSFGDFDMNAQSQNTKQ